MFNHSALHYTSTLHPIVLNIKEVEKKKNENEEQPKITKLAIGKPGGAEIPSQNYEKIVEVKCLQCNNKVLDYTKSPQLNSLVTSIINTSSVLKEPDIKAWEEVFYPCEHTLTLVQHSGIKIAEKSIAKCNDCELSTNLWLCLTCGNLSCGRQETGGHAHAIEHFKKTNHPLVVKTGTITPEGDASLYCYACNNDVKDDNLPAHLSNFGIDINTQVKTDKTLAEMNLSYNLNFTLSKTIEEGKVLIPLYGPGYTGLENLGNSCYMNSVIQILFSLEFFQKNYFDNALEHLQTCTNFPMKCHICQLSKIIYGLHSGIYSVKKTRELPYNEETKTREIEEYQDGIRPASFKFFFGEGHPDFSSNKQQDALEYLSYLLEKIKNYEKRRKINPFKLFEFDIDSRLECNECHSVKYRTTRQWYLPFSFDDWKNKKDESASCNIEECIGKFLGQELLTDVNCGVCKKKTSFIKEQRIKNFPPILIVMFQRFVYDWTPIKLETRFEFPIDNLDLKQLQREIKKPGEKIIEENSDGIEADEVEEKEMEFNQESVNFLLQCGIPELGAKWALYKNNGDPDMAMGWYCENTENPEIQLPLPKVKVKKGNKGANGADGSMNPNDIETLISMGFSRDKAVFALMKNSNNVERALDYLFNNAETIDEEMKNDKEEAEQEKKEINQGNGNIFNLYAYLTHLGKNSDMGHYVCHIRKDGKNWTYFNDLRVNQWENPPIHKGYVYFFKNTQTQNN